MKKLVIFMMAFAASALLAQNPYRGAYVGAGLGSADPGGFDSAEFVEVHAGFRYGRYFALEAGFVQFGDFEFEGITKDITKETVGLKVLAICHLPLGDRFGFHAGGGVLFSDSDEDVTINGVMLSEGDSGTGLALEGGIQFRLTDRWTLDLEYARYMLDTYDFELNLNGDNVDVISDDETLNAGKLSLSYRF